MANEIELHPGHWKNPGSGANGFLNEVTEARRVTKRVYEILKASGVPATYFEDNTSTNQTQNLNAIVKHHNADRNGLIVSIHFNASGGSQDRGIGTEVLYYNQKVLAEKVAKAISEATGGGLINRGAKQRTGLAVLARTYEPAILIEVCFVNSSVDAAIYRRDFEKICQAIAKELAAHIGKTLKQPTVTTAEVKEAKPVAKRDINVVSDWAADDWKEAQANGYFDGTRPGAPITREEAAIVINRLRKNILGVIEGQQKE